MKKLLVVALAALVSAFAFAESAKDVVRKSVTIKAPDYTNTVIQMELFDKNGKLEDARTLMQYGFRKDDPKGDIITTVFDFVKSNQIKGTRFLQQEKSNKTDDKWIYMPSLGQVRRVNVTERKKAFVNSDFTYNDMNLRSADKDDHVFLNENATYTNGSGQKFDCWQVKSTPSTDKDVEYAYRVQMIDKKTFLPVQCIFYDKADGINKILSIDEVSETVGVTGKKYPLRKVVSIVNKKNGHSTKVTVKEQTADKKVSDRYFTQNWLQTGK